MGDRRPVIAGIGLSDYPVALDLDSVQHHALAMQRALADCGVAKADIDGYMCAGGGDMTETAVSMAEYLGIDHRFIDGTMTGGSSFEFYVQHAAAAIRQGLCDTILVTYGSDLLSKQGRMLGSKGFYGKNARVGGALQYEAPYGNILIGAYAMAAQCHMHEYGTTSEQPASIAVAVRSNAALNPSALYRDPITVDDVLSSRMIADPLHKLDCCVISDGGGALVITTAERARDLRQPPVYVLGAAGLQTHWNIRQMPDFTTAAAVRSGAEAQHSDWGILLARTDPDQPKHRGITYFLLDMTAAGIDIRPLRQLTGAAHFNEVFLTDVRVPPSNVLGEVNGGWGVAMTTLANERAFMGGGGPAYAFDDLVALARRSGRAGDPVVRQRLAAAYTRYQLVRYLGQRARVEPAVGLGMKLFYAQHLTLVGDLAMAVQGAGATIAGAPWQQQFLSAPSIRIAGGSDEVQRNILGERVLGLPPDMRVDKSVPFRTLPAS